ncbi:MAG: tetratricopeptide repeat protein [Bacteroidota bacterium]
MKFTLILLLCISCSAFGQNFQKMFDEAEQNMQKGNYSEAITYYNDILDFDHNIPIVYVRIGQAYFLNLEYNKALTVLHEFVQEYPQKYPEAYFLLGEVNSLLGNTIEAQKNFALFLSLKPQNSHYINRAEFELEKDICAIHSAPDIVPSQDTMVNFIHNYGVYTFDSLIIYNGISSYNDSLLSPAHIIMKNGNNSEKIITDSTSHISDFCRISTDTILINIRSYSDINSFPETHFVTHSSGNFSIPKKYTSHIQDKDAVTIHFFIDSIAHSQYLFFSSDRKGGYGGMDIWISERKNGIFHKPFNAGKEINTEGDEICPFYDSHTQTLYFSSNRHTTIGGFDIFYAQDSAFSFDYAQSIGTPINSSFNEYYYTIINDTAYYCSNNRAKKFHNSDFYFNSLYRYPISNKKVEKHADSLTTQTEKQDSTFSYTLYYDHNKPDPTSTKSYTELFEDYISTKPQLQKPEYLSLNGIKKQVYLQSIKSFFTTAEYEYEQYTSFLQKCSSALSQGYTVSIQIQASTSKSGSKESNQIIASHRAENIKKHIFQKIPETYHSQISVEIAPSIIPKHATEYSHNVQQSAQESISRHVQVSATIHYSESQSSISR